MPTNRGAPPKRAGGVETSTHKGIGPNLGPLIKSADIHRRNRRAACKLAGVEPVMRRLDGEDPTAFIIAANVNRRHMTKGQRAMAVAKLLPEPEKGGRGNKVFRDETVSRGGLSKARSVLRFAPDLADNVLSGVVS